jgi:predicted transcriptional regulator
MTRVALLSIHKRHADAILDGSKTIELRKCPPKQPISHVLLYVTQPTARVVGVVEVDEVLHQGERPWCAFWDVFGWRASTTTYDEASAYFDVNMRIDKVGSGILLGKAVRFPPLPLSAFGVQRPPQSFCYVSDDDAAWAASICDTLQGAA